MYAYSNSTASLRGYNPSAAPASCSSDTNTVDSGLASSQNPSNGILDYFDAQRGSESAIDLLAESTPTLTDMEIGEMYYGQHQVVTFENHSAALQRSNDDFALQVLLMEKLLSAASSERNDVELLVHRDVYPRYQAAPNYAEFEEKIALTERELNVFRARIAELKIIAAEEGYSIKPRSLRDFWKFVSQYRFIKADALFADEDGILNAVWTDQGKTGRVSIDFLGHGYATFAIIRYWNNGNKTRIVGSDNLAGIKRQIEIHELQGQLEL